MKKYFLLLLIILYPVSISANIDISAHCAVVLDTTSNRVLFEKNAYEENPMASTTKIMTAILALENSELNDIVTVSPHASAVEGSSIWLDPLEKISMEDLLYGLMLASGNDAATAIAEHISGNEEAFALLMTQKAKEIGATSTSFKNPNGLPAEGHYTTARDLALITSYAMQNPHFREIVNTKRKVIPHEGAEWDRSLKNHNKLLNLYPYANGVKTGYTKSSGRCLVSSATKDMNTVVAVTLNAPDDWNDHIKMLDYAFETYSSYLVCKKGEECAKIPIFGASEDYVTLICDDDFSLLLLEGEDKKVVSKINLQGLKLPIHAGDKLGELVVYFDNKEISRINVTSKIDIVRKNNFTNNILLLIKELITQ